MFYMDAAKVTWTDPKPELQCWKYLICLIWGNMYVHLICGFMFVYLICTVCSWMLPRCLVWRACVCFIWGLSVCEGELSVQPDPQLHVVCPPCVSDRRGSAGACVLEASDWLLIIPSLLRPTCFVTAALTHTHTHTHTHTLLFCFHFLF